MLKLFNSHRKKIFHARSSFFRISFFFFTLSFCVLTALISISYVKEKSLTERKRSALAKKEQEITLPPLSIQAKSFVVYDIESKQILLSKGAETVLPLASLTKIKTADLYASSYDIEKNIVIPNLGNKHVYDYTLKPGDSWSSKDLLAFMLTISSNDAAEILALSAKGGRDSFIQKMNESSASTSLLFTTPSGLDIGNEIGGLGTAIDTAKLVAHFYQNFPSVFEATTKTSISVTINGQKMSGIPNTNSSVEKYQSISGSKTGFTDKAGGNLAIIYDEGFGRPVAVVLLGSTKEGRFKDMETILSYIKTNSSFLYSKLN